MKHYDTELTTLNFIFNLLKFSPIIMLPLGWWVSGTTFEDETQTGTRIIFTIISTLIFWIYFLFRYGTEKKALTGYLQSLIDKNLDDALYYGRIYYGIKRQGIMGLKGDNLSVDDEQRITNDINSVK